MTAVPEYGRQEQGQYNASILTKLVENYRSNEYIINVPNRLFYEGELKVCADEFRDVFVGWEELPNKKCPLIFHPVFGKDEREENSPSFFNIAEVETVVMYLKKLLDPNEQSKTLKGNAYLKPQHIGIISPYRRQVN